MDTYKTRKSIYESNYDRLQPYITSSHHLKLRVANYMPLVIEQIGDNEYSLAHYYEQNGDLMRDPELTIKVYPESKAVEVLSYQQDNLGLYQVVYPMPGSYYPRLKKSLNSFLRQWLVNLKNQGFEKEAEKRH